jgi:hypothetical protein
MEINLEYFNTAVSKQLYDQLKPPKQIPVSKNQSQMVYEKVTTKSLKR